MDDRCLRWASLVSLVVLVILPTCSRRTDTLPSLGIDINGTSVSGVSAGAFMAAQLHVAHSKEIVGSGIVAGGPYGCAESRADSVLPATRNAVSKNLWQAYYCLNGKGIPNIADLVQRAEDLAKDGHVDPLINLKKSRVYLFSGGKDTVVASSVVEAAKLFYVYAGVSPDSIALITRDNAGHSFLTLDTGHACGVSEKPFINDCDYDQAGAILEWIYGELKPPAEHASGKFLFFDQSPFSKEPGSDLTGKGVVYIPTSCARKAGCRLHIALHGCRQNRDQVGMTFIQGSGYARWADTNRLVILFPQVKANNVNHKACWDWWGYTGKKFLTKEAAQISAIWKMVQQLARPT